MPLPPATARSAKTSRTSVASTPSAAAIPLQTPATTRSSSTRAKSSCSRAARPPSGCVRDSPTTPTDRSLVADFEVAQPDVDVEHETPRRLLRARVDDSLPEPPAALFPAEDVCVAAVH